MLHLTVGEHTVDVESLHTGLELGAQLGTQSQALLLAGEVHHVLTLVHGRGTTSGQLVDLLLRRRPSNGVLLLSLSSVQKSASAALERGKHVTELGLGNLAKHIPGLPESGQLGAHLLGLGISRSTRGESWGGPGNLLTSGSHHGNIAHLRRSGSGELDSGRVNVASNVPHILVGAGTASIHLLREDTILGVQMLHLTVGEHTVDVESLHTGLELGAQLGTQSQALLLAGEVHHVLTLVHGRGTTSGQLVDLLLRRRPSNGVLLLSLSSVQKSASAALERGKHVTELGLGNLAKHIPGLPESGQLGAHLLGLGISRRTRGESWGGPGNLFPRGSHHGDTATVHLLGCLAGELDSCRVDVGANIPHVLVCTCTTGVHLLREHSISRMQELRLTIGEDTVDGEVFDPGLEFGAELGT